MKCFSWNFLGNWTISLRLVLPEKKYKHAKTYFPFPEFSLWFTAKLSNTDIYHEFFAATAKIRLGLAEFLKNSYFFIRGQCLLHWSTSSPASPVHWDTYEWSLESRLIAIVLTVSEDATTWPDMPQSVLKGHRSQACFSEYVQKYSLTKTSCLEPVIAFVEGIVSSSNSEKCGLF